MSKMPLSSSIEDPVRKMNRMYRWTRHVYDWSRRYYLLGRDRMLRAIAEQPRGNVLEIGCGTARNLRMLDQHAPQHTLYGLDASLSMLTTARAKMEREGCLDDITLGHGLAQALDSREQFGVERDFDVIFFSYVLSMIPDWTAALGSALAHLAPGGRIHIVDFWDQADLPEWTAMILQRWLALFDVYPRPDLIRALRRLDEVDGVTCTVAPVAYRYAYCSTIRVSGSVSASAFDGLGMEVPSVLSASESKRFEGLHTIVD